MTTILHASDSADFLGAVPALAGFTPSQSLVLLPFQGSRAPGAMRLDLPDPAHDPVSYAASAVELISRVPGTDAVAVVVYSDDAAEHTRDGLVLPFDVLVDVLRAQICDGGLRLVDALCVTPDGWASYLDDDPRLAPLSTIPSAPAVPGVGDVSGDQAAGAELPHVDLVESERVGRALAELSFLLGPDGPTRLTGAENPQAIAATMMLDDAPELFETVLEMPETLPPFATAALVWCLERPLLRDVALSQWATDITAGRRALAVQLDAAEGSTAFPEDLAEIFLGHGPAPDADRLRLALTVVRGAAARAPRASRPGPLTVAAWLSWALGRASHADHYLALAREIDPQYRLAGLLATLMDTAVLPDWAFRRGPVAGAA